MKTRSASLYRTYSSRNKDGALPPPLGAYINIAESRLVVGIGSFGRNVAREMSGEHDTEVVVQQQQQQQAVSETCLVCIGVANSTFFTYLPSIVIDWDVMTSTMCIVK